MKKAIQLIFLSLFLCFYGNAFAGLSDQEKIDIIREVAGSFPEKQTFYKWVSKKDRDTILLDGKVTPEIYEYFMQFKGHFSFAGPGIYVDIFAFQGILEGEILIQFETEPDRREFFLSNKNLLRSLSERGVTLEDLYRLESNITLMSFDKEALQGKVVLKGPEGVRITPFTGDGWPLSQLLRLVMDEDLSEAQEQFVFDTVKKDIRKRAEKYMDLMDPKKKISKKEMDRELYKLSGRAPVLFPDEPWFINVGANLLLFGERVLPKRTLRTIARYMVLKDNYGHVFQVLSVFPSVMEYLSLSDRSKMVQNATPKIQTAENGTAFFTAIGDYDLYKKDVSKTVEAIVPLLTSVQEGIKLLQDASYREYYESFIREDAPDLKELADNMEKTFGFNPLNIAVDKGRDSSSIPDTLKQAMKDPQINERLKRAINELFLEANIPGITQRMQDAKNGFNKNYTLSPMDRRKIMDRMLEFAQDENEIRSWPLFPSELERALKKFRSSQCHNSLKKE